MVLLLLHCSAAVVASSPWRARAAPVVHTRDGPIEGKAVEQSHDLPAPVDSFIGIPFAAAPVGDLRWGAPAPHAPWSNIRKATAYGAACVQDGGGAAFHEFPLVAMSEDCLFLNVYRPHLTTTNASSSMPIMVFFYGGSYKEGAASFFVYDGSMRVATSVSLRASHGTTPTIIVTVNYRLGIFGYGGHDALRDPASHGSTGNWGVLDQRAGLEWVRDNAAALGGDANRVTVFGESAGSGSVATHIVAPGSNGLFHRAVMESGPTFSPWIATTMARASAVFTGVAGRARCNSTAGGVPNIACMRALNATYLQTISHDVDQFLPRSPKTSELNEPLEYAPTVDGIVLTALPKALVAAGKLNPSVKGIILGTNQDEGTLFVDKKTVEKMDGNASAYLDYVTKQLGENATLGAEAVALYPLLNGFNGSAWEALSAIEGDAAMSCPARETARVLSASTSAKVWLYFFTHSFDLAPILGKLIPSIEGIGVAHATELIVVFDTRVITGEFKAERALADAVGGYWLRFAASGDPGGAEPDLVAWPEYKESSDLHLRLDVGANLKVGKGLKKVVCDFWRESATPQQ